MSAYTTTTKRSIAILGDSIPKGVVLSEKKKYIFSKEGFIKKLTQKLRANVFDFSKFGTTTLYGKKLLRSKVTEVDPDIVLIEYGGNDCDYNWDEVAETPQKEHLPKLSPAAFGENIKEMTVSLKKAGKTPVLVNLPPLDPQRYFNWFGKGDNERKGRILEWLLRIDNIYWWHERYSYIVDKIAAVTGSHLINIRRAFLDKPDYRDYICEDGIHPNAEGQTLIERMFLRYIEKHAAYILG